MHKSNDDAINLCMCLFSEICFQPSLQVFRVMFIERSSKDKLTLIEKLFTWVTRNTHRRSENISNNKPKQINMQTFFEIFDQFVFDNWLLCTKTSWIIFDRTNLIEQNLEFLLLFLIRKFFLTYIPVVETWISDSSKNKFSQVYNNDKKEILRCSICKANRCNGQRQIIC